jgi:protein-arginine kinase activator protein McsA
LDLAIREERYEYAAKIRDDIKKITESYVTKNETVTDDDWNF